MADSIRQQIIDAMETRFGAIVLPGTYNSIRQQIIDLVHAQFAGLGLGEGALGDDVLGYD